MNGIIQAIPIYSLFLVFAFAGLFAQATSLSKKFLFWYSLAILVFYPIFFFIGDTYHGIWYLAPTGFLASFWLGKLLKEVKEEGIEAIPKYWKGYFLGVLLIIALGAGVHFFGKNGNGGYSILCGVLFVCAFFTGIIGTILSPKYTVSHMENTHLMTPYEVVDQRPAKPIFRGFFNALGFLPLIAFLVMLATIAL